MVDIYSGITTQRDALEGTPGPVLAHDQDTAHEQDHGRHQGDTQDPGHLVGDFQQHGHGEDPGRAPHTDQDGHLAVPAAREQEAEARQGRGTGARGTDLYEIDSQCESLSCAHRA